MLYPLWTAKSGAGCTTVALGASLAAARPSRRRRAAEVLLVDLGGDLPVAVGLPKPAHGLSDWLAAPGADEVALRRLEVSLGHSGVTLLPLGTAARWDDTRSGALLAMLAADDRTVVVDVSTLVGEPLTPLERLRIDVASAAPSLLVTRSCYLALRRFLALGAPPSGVVLVREPGRTLDRFDVAELAGSPVVVEVDCDPVISRSVDSGSMTSRPPKRFLRQVAGVVR